MNKILLVVTFRLLRNRTTLHIFLDSHTDIPKITKRHWWQLLLQSLAFPPIPQRLCCKHSQVYCRETNIPEELPYGKLQIPAVQSTLFLGSSHTTGCSSSLLPYPVRVMPHAVNLLVEEWQQKVWPPCGLEEWRNVVKVEDNYISADSNNWHSGCESWDAE